MIEAFLVYFCAICAFPIKRLWTHYESLAFFLPMLLSLCSVIALRLKNRQPIIPQSLSKSPFCWFLTLYSGFCLLSCFQPGHFSAILVEVAYRLIVLWFFIYLYACGPRKASTLILALSIFLAIAFAYVSGTIWCGFKVGFGPAVGPEFNTQKNDLGDVCSSFLLVAFAFALYNKRKWQSLFLWTSIPLALLAIAATQSKGALLGAIVGSFLMLIARRAKTRYFTIWFIVVPVTLLLLVTMMPREAAERASSFKTGTSLHFRSLYWDLVGRHITRHPFQAIGLNQPLVVDGIGVKNYCNFLLQDYVEIGPGGAAISLLMVLSAIWLPLKNRHLAAAKTSIAAVNTVCVGLIASRFAHGLFDTFWDYSIRNLIAFEAIGMALFVQMWIEHKHSSSVHPPTS